MQTVEDRIGTLPCWAGSVTIEPLPGGLSNQNYLVKDAAGGHVVRFGTDYPFHHVLREREAMTARAAHRIGLGPEVLYAEPGVLVTAYLGASPLDPGGVRAESLRLADLLGRFHREMPREVSGPGYLFWVFHVLRDYARTLADAGHSPAEMPRWLTLADELERAQVPLPIIFGHNDLLPANILDDGDRLWLIDFEYAGFSTAMFDLAGLTSNAAMASGESEAFLAAYLGEPPTAELRRAHAAMQCASLLREAMWGLISGLFLTTAGVDYAAYSADNAERFEAALEHYRSAYGDAA